MEELDIISYGVSMTTLEEVFLKANGDHEDKNDKKSGKPSFEPGSDEFYEQDAREHRGSSINSKDRPLDGSQRMEEEKKSE